MILHKVTPADAKNDPLCVASATHPKHRFCFGGTVLCDNDRENSLIVIGVTYRPEGAVEFELAYWHNGEHKITTVSSWRLSAKPI